MKNTLLKGTLQGCLFILIITTIEADQELEQLKQRVSELEVEVAQWRPVLKDLAAKQKLQKIQTSTEIVAGKITLEQFVANAPHIQKTTLQDLIKAGVDRAQISQENLQKYGIDVGPVNYGMLAAYGINPNRWNFARAFSNSIEQGSEYALEGSPVILE